MKKFLSRSAGRLMSLCLLLLVALSITPPKAATAATTAEPTAHSYAGEWEITFEIINSQIHAVWIGRVWDYAVGDGEIIAQRRVDISADCEPFGDPLLGESDITLDGIDDYVRCKIPNFPAIFLTMTPELGKCRCYYDGPPYVAADVSPVYSTLAQPVVYHNRLFLNVVHQDTKGLRFPFVHTSAPALPYAPVRMDANNSLGVAELTLRFLDDTIQNWQSNRFSVWQQNGYQIWAGYDAARYVANNSENGFAKFLAENGFWEQVQPDYSKGFFMWESQAVSKYNDEAMPASFGLGPGTYVYIGHNPELNTFYHGVMRSVAIDPGCRGH
jgi:hypothetical protein